MEVMKPWIATRVTELLGFEDEVLINFIFGLLDAKVLFSALFNMLASLLLLTLLYLLQNTDLLNFQTNMSL